MGKFSSIILFVLSASGSNAQINIEKYFDKSSLGFLNLKDYSDIQFEWTMKKPVQLSLHEGMNYLHEGDLQRALQSLNNVVKIDSGLWVGYYYRGVILKKLFLLESAKRDFLMCLILNSRVAEAHSELGEIFHASRYFNEADAYYRKAIKINPEFVQAYFNLGNLYISKSDVGSAVRYFQKCNSIDPNFPDAYLAAGILKLNYKTKIKQAILLFDRAIKADSSFFLAYFWRGLANIKANQPEKCLPDWNRLIRFRPNDVFLLKMRGYLFVELGRFDEAFSDFRKSLLANQIDESKYYYGQTLLDKSLDLQSVVKYVARNGYGLKEKSFDYLKKGMCLFISGQTVAASKCIYQSEKLEPSASAYYLHAMILEHVPNQDSAFLDYGKALELDKNIFDANKKRCIHLIKSKKLTEAQTELDEMFRLQPQSTTALRLRGLIRAGSHDCNGAIEDLTKILNIDRMDQEALLARAECEKTAGNLKDAQEDALSFINLNPGNQVLEKSIRKLFLLPAIPDYSKDMKIQQLENKSDLVKTYIDSSRFEVARSEISNLKVDWGPETWYNREAYWVIHELEGQLELKMGNFDNVIKIMNKVLAEYPSTLWAIYLRGKALLQKGQMKKGLEDLRQIPGYLDSDSLYKSANQNSQRP